MSAPIIGSFRDLTLLTDRRAGEGTMGPLARHEQAAARTELSA